MDVFQQGFRGVLSLALFVAACPARAQTDAGAVLTQPAVGKGVPYAGICKDETAAIQLDITGFRDRTGHTRAELYPPNDPDFLADDTKLMLAGKVFKRIDIQTPETGDAVICMPVPGPGQYTMSILHDRNENRKFDAFKDGFGFPNNPKLGWSQPKADQVRVTVGDKPLKITVVLNYTQGFSARPWRGKN